MCGPQISRCVMLLLMATAIIGGTWRTAQPAPFDPDRPYTVTEDGTVDWYVYSGYRRYHSDCHVCHGPDGLGSSFGPALVESLKKLNYEDFLDVVINGRKNVSTSSDNVMPAFGLNQNVMCFVDDIYAYLKARSDDKVARGRPAKHEDKPEDVKERDAGCMGSASGG
jgi:methanol metabolism-related c-type cytochrome